VPSDTLAKLPKWADLQRVALTYLRSVTMLVIMGFSSTPQKECRFGQACVSMLLHAVIGGGLELWGSGIDSFLCLWKPGCAKGVNGMATTAHGAI